jgi:hypothetical protein
MSESSLGPVHWLHGLEDYFEFTKDTESKKYVEFILKLVYANNPVIATTETGSMEEFVYALRKFATAPILDVLYKYYREGYDPVPLQDAFSRGQVQSKIWLATELAKIKKDFSMVYLLGGWYGQLLNYLSVADISYNKARSIDIDSTACEISDKVFNLEYINEYKVKSVELDLNELEWLKDGAKYPVKNFTHGKIFYEVTMPDLVINTSSEHMTDDWFFKIKFKEYSPSPIVAIQSNNLLDIPEHINSVHSIDHMKKKFPMSEILYEGEIQLTGYKRFMLIGRP